MARRAPEFLARRPVTHCSIHVCLDVLVIGTIVTIQHKKRETMTMSKLLTIAAILAAFMLAAPVFADDASVSPAAKTAAECSTAPNEAVASSCQLCGDGYCAKSCGENEKTCPKDCSAVDS